MLLQKREKLARNVKVVGYVIIWRTIFTRYIRDLIQQLFAAPVRHSRLVLAHIKMKQAWGDKIHESGS
jgi:hypothetical protein